MIIRFVIPAVINNVTRVECMYLSNTTLFHGRGIYSIYYIRYNYMFRRLLSISCTTWRWPLSSAETCSCTLCNKYYIYLYHQTKLCHTSTCTPLWLLLKQGQTGTIPLQSIRITTLHILWFTLIAIFDVLLTMHLSIFISVINRFEHMCSSSGGQNCFTQPLVLSHL